MSEKPEMVPVMEIRVIPFKTRAQLAHEAADALMTEADAQLARTRWDAWDAVLERTLAPLGEVSLDALPLGMESME
jgi:hypothetical protein